MADVKDRLVEELVNNGYPHARLRTAYVFSSPDKDSAAATVDVAAFTTDVPNYDSAAFGIICGTEQPSAEKLASAVWLGAPIVFSVSSSDEVGVWKIRHAAHPTHLATIDATDIARLFAENKSRWDPNALAPAKTRSLKPGSADVLVDPGLIDFLDHRWEEHCLGAFTRLALRIRSNAPEASPHERSQMLYRAIRSELDMAQGNPSRIDLPRSTDGNIASDLDGIPDLRNVSPITVASMYAEALRAAEWTSSQRYGRLPLSISSYLADNSGFGEGGNGRIVVPDASPGSIQLMLASMRRRASLMAADLSSADVADDLTAKTEVVVRADNDAMVARNAFKLATYPLEGEPSIRREPRGLPKSSAQGRTVLADLRGAIGKSDAFGRSSDSSKRSRTSASVVASDLAEVIDSGVESLSAILPRGFLHQKRFERSRRLLGRRFGTLELAGFPRRGPWSEVFDACVVIAKQRREGDGDHVSSVTSRSVADGDWERFLSGGGFTVASSVAKDVSEGNLWQPRHAEIWNALQRNPRLGEVAEVRRGFTISPGADRPVLGRAEANRALQFGLRDADVFRGGFERSMRRELYTDGAPAKILLPAVDLAGSVWPVRAFSDFASLGATPAFLAILPRPESVPAEALEAILNGPIANAYFNEFMSSELSKTMVANLPLPRGSDYAAVVLAVRRHKEILGAAMDTEAPSESLLEALNASLVRVDAAVLKQYDLAPGLENGLLKAFLARNAERRVGFEFSTWRTDGYTGSFRLHDYVDPRYQKSKGPWILKAIEPLSAEEFEAVRPFIRP